MRFRTGILLDSLQIPIDDALDAASAAGVDGIQLYAVSHAMSTLKLDYKAAQSLKQKVGSYELEISALCGDLGGHGFEIREENNEKIAKTKEVIDFAHELEVGIISTHIGVVSADDIDKRRIMQEALKEICRYAGTRGISIAVETGPEPAAVLRKFIEETGEPNLKVNFDPANLLMVQGEKPAEAVHILKDFIVHTHAKDGRMIKQCNPVEIYNAFAEGNPGNIDIDSYFVELALGKGDVDFPEYLQALEAVGYDGYLTIEREAGNSRLRDITDGIKYLEVCMHSLSNFTT